ncbi:MAG: hypothetical protein WD342_07825 [Verrucomicrobiales bacterium]
MSAEDRFPTSPPIRFRLTKAQAAKIEEAKQPGESVMVCGYSRCHTFPINDRFALCA